MLALALIALNMRTVFASLPPLLEEVRHDLGLSAAVAGLLTTVPLLCFGLFALLVPALVRAVAIQRTVAVCAGLTAVGAAARGIGGTAALFAGTLLAGTAVALGQGVIPILARADFTGRVGAVTGVFSAGLTFGSAAAAATAVPLANRLGGWEPALAAYAVPAAFGSLVWMACAPGATRVHRGPPLALWKSGRAWSVACYFALQTMAFYACLTWLPSILQSHGYSETAAGEIQALGNAIQFLPAFVVPIFAGRRSSQTSVLVVLVAAGAIGFLGLAIAPGVAVLWVCVLGMAQGGALGLALVLPILRGRGAPGVAALTVLTLTVGYLVAAAGPPLVGLAHDAVGGWRIALVCLIVITLAELPPGLVATRPWGIAPPER